MLRTCRSVVHVIYYRSLTRAVLGVAGKPLLDKIEAEMENAQKARAAAGGKAHCSGKTCIFQVRGGVCVCV